MMKVETCFFWVLCEQSIPMRPKKKLQDNDYINYILGSKMLANEEAMHEKMSIEEMRKSRSMYGENRKDKTRNECI